MQGMHQERPEAPVVNMRYPIVQAQILTGKKRQGPGRASKTVAHAVVAERTAVEQSARWVGCQANVKHAHSLMQVTAILYANPGWSPADGGKLRLWPPRMIDPSSTAHASPHPGHPAAGIPSPLLFP